MKNVLKLSSILILFVVSLNIIFEKSAFAWTTSREIRNSIFQSVEDKKLKFYEIDVIARQGSVILLGTVASEADKAALTSISKNTPGVRSVKNYLKVKKPEIETVRARLKTEAIQPSDQEITAAVLKELKRSTNINLDKIKIKTENGKVKLSGSLNNHREIDHVLSVVLMVDGVEDIKSDILIGERRYTR